MATKRKRLSTCSSSSITPKKDGKASDASDSWDRKKKKELPSQFLLKDTPEPPFRATCIKAIELEAFRRHPNSDRNEDQVQKDVHESVEEEISKQDQARLSTVLARLTTQRLLGDEKTGTEGVLESGRKLVPQKYRLKGAAVLRYCIRKCSNEKPGIAKLTGVTTFPNVDGQGGGTIFGTLEAHGDKFIYTTSSSSFHMQFTYKHVKEAFVQVEDGKIPFLHFHLHHPIKVGSRMTKDIQFRLVPAPVERGRLEKVEKEKQTWCKGRNEDLKYFVDEVPRKWQGSPFPFRFRRVFKVEEFHGVLPSKESAVFSLTLSSLVRLENSPFFVVNREDVEIVNLARRRPREIDMTVVLKDFALLQISSISVDSLNGIKRCLNFWGVKFYENDLDPNCWNSIVKKVTDSPETFIQDGGWDAYKLEDNATSLYYKHYYLEASQVV